MTYSQGHESPRQSTAAAHAAIVELEHVVAQQIGEGIWRVRDRNVPEHDALCVLGIIETTDGGFLTLFIGDAARRRFSPTFDGAIRQFVLRRQPLDGVLA
jgi:hypothetical protein